MKKYLSQPHTSNAKERVEGQNTLGQNALGQNCQEKFFMVRRSEGSQTAKGIVGQRTVDGRKFLLLFRIAPKKMSSLGGPTLKKL